MFAVFAGISIREFARREGCSDTLVRRAIKQGKLQISAENLLDPEQVGSGWKKSNRTAANSANKGANSAGTVRSGVRAAKAAAQEAPPSAEEAGEAEQELFSEEVENFLDNVLAGTYADTGTAERVKENALAAKHLLAARRDAGHLIEIDVAKDILFETHRAQRDAWIGWPSRIGPLLAAELELDADKVVEALTAHVHQQLDDLGDPEGDFTSKREG